MLDEDERAACLRRQNSEQLSNGFETAGRGTKANHKEMIAVGPTRL
jgi:hypothetical protein